MPTSILRELPVPNVRCRLPMPDAGCHMPDAGGQWWMPMLAAGCRCAGGSIDAGAGCRYRMPVPGPDAGCRLPDAMPDAGKQKMYIMKLSGRRRFWRILSSVQHTNFTDAAAKSTWQTQTSNSAVISCRANFVSFSTYFSLKACVPKNFSTAPSELPSIV